MKKNKLGLFALGIASLGFLTCLTSGETKSSSLDSLLPKDTTFLVSLSGSEKSLGEDGVKASQQLFTNRLRNVVGNNFTVIETYDALNTVKIKANKGLQSTISTIPGVQKVALNQKYRFGETYGAQRTQNEIKEGFVPFANNTTGTTPEKLPDGTEKNQSLETMNVPQSDKGGAGTFVAILDSGFYMEHTAFKNFDNGSEAMKKANERFSYQDLLKVKDKLVGKPAKTLSEKDIAAPSYQNANLNDGSTYYNPKIPYYYDYGGSNLNEGNDFDVLSRVSEHGTHVASITGANGTFKGIAPNTQLALMKCFFEQIPGPDQKDMPAGVYATEEDIVQALNDCATLGVDSLNMSLGTDLDDFANKSTAVDLLKKLNDDYGCLCNVAAGNAGKALFKSMNTYKDWATDHVDTGILGSYAVSQDANIIASSTNPTQYYEKGLVFEKDGKTSVVGYDDQVDYTDGSDGIKDESMQKLLKDAADPVTKKVELITAGIAGDDGNYYGDAGSYGKATIEDPKLFHNKVVVVDRGSTSFLDKATQAQENGAKGLIVINNDPTAIEFTFGMSWSEGENNFKVPEIPVVFVLYRDRDLILNKILTDVKDSKGNIIAKEGSAKIIEKSEEQNPDKDQLSDFSSDGSTSDLKLNPTISAPGTSIRGATLGKTNSKGIVEDLDPYYYEYLSGTSMATPNYTGAVAMMIGEQNFKNNDERVAYMKSLTMRAMSTANQYVSTSYNFDKINVKKATTTDEYKKEVKIYVPEQQNADGTSGNKNVAPYTPRKQGAGVIDVKKALTSKVYLEGLKVNNDGSFSNIGVKHSKIELKNNDLISKGKIKVGFRVHNELNTDVTYNVKMKIMAPEITSYHSHDNSLPNYVGKDTNLEGAKLQTVYDKVLEDNVSLGTISLKAGETTKDWTSKEHPITDATKKYLEHFENGTFLEGYVYLEPATQDPTNEANGIVPLSIPYLGFYGDYAQADATEPFNFEKDAPYNAKEAPYDTQIGIAGKDKLPGKLHGSDLINALGKNSYLLDTIDTSSMIAADSFENYNNLEKQSSIITNNNSISNFANEIMTKKDANGNTTLYVGGDKTDVLYIQEYVYRSILSEKVEIFDKFGSLVTSKNVTDILTNGTQLYKSIIVTSLIGQHSLIHRGYCELPLYNTKTGVKLPNGNYKIKFTYDLIYGSTQTKTFNLVIDGSKPLFAGKTILTNGDKKVLRLKFNEIYVSSAEKVYVNAGITPFVINKVSDGYIIDIDLDKAFVNGKAFIEVTDGAYNITRYMINEGDFQQGLSIESDKLTYGGSYSYTKENGPLSENTNINETYTIKAKDYQGKDLELGEFTAVISLDKKINKSAQVIGIDDNGKERALTYTLVDSTTIRVTTHYTKIKILDEGGFNLGFQTEDNATIKVAETTNGKVFCDRTTGRTGDQAIVYAIADKGFKVDKVVVNGKVITPDQYGNYVFVVEGGENLIQVTFVEAK